MYPQANAEGGALPPARVEPERWRALEAAVSYFMAILTVSWMLAPVREFFVRAGADPLLGTLSQAAATLLLLTYAAGWVVRTFSVPPRLGLRLAVGVGAVAIFVACDTVSALLLFDLNPLDMTAGLIGPQGLVIAVMMGVAAILPVLRARSVGR